MYPGRASRILPPSAVIAALSFSSWSANDLSVARVNGGTWLSLLVLSWLFTQFGEPGQGINSVGAAFSFSSWVAAAMEGPTVGFAEQAAANIALSKTLAFENKRVIEATGQMPATRTRSVHRDQLALSDGLCLGH